jgi:hypothetical protein
VRYHFTSIRKAIILKNDYFEKDVEKLEPSCITGESRKWSSHCEKQYHNSSKNKTEARSQRLMPVILATW